MATGTVNSGGIPLRRHTGPGANYPVVSPPLADGSSVTIICQAQGTVESGEFGPTPLWDRLDDNTYVSDAFVNTGTNGRVAPDCGAAQDQRAGTIQQRLDRFLGDWDGKFLNYDDSVPDQCFSVANAWAKQYLGLHDFTGEFASGIIDQGGSDFTRVDKTASNFPPAGAIVVFHECPAHGIGAAGHVDVCVSADSAGFVGFDQNWAPDPHCRKVTHDYQGVTGWLIPNRLG
jgi:hypothetical protein